MLPDKKIREGGVPFWNTENLKFSCKFTCEPTHILKT